MSGSTMVLQPVCDLCRRKTSDSRFLSTLTIKSNNREHLDALAQGVADSDDCSAPSQAGREDYGGIVEEERDEQVASDNKASADGSAVDPQKTARRRDKLAFMIGSAHLWLTAYWLGSYPSTFYKLYIIKALVLFSIRWASFKKQKMHYYMFDFCYIVNFLLIAFLSIWPESDYLFKVLFAYSSGPLAWSVILFQNSFVYHSLYEVTSLFLHFYPVLVAYTIRWYPDCGLFGICDSDTEKSTQWGQASAYELLVWPVLPYLLWAILYYLKIFIISQNKIQKRGYKTLYTYMTEEQIGMCAKIVKKFPDGWQPLVYMGCHFMLCMSGLLFVVIWWNNFYMHSALLAVTTGVSTWNAAAHYFEN